MSKTVNFIEAVNSGKRFRIVGSGDDDWLVIERHGYIYWKSERQALTTEYINAQYEIEEKTITLTESQFDKAFSNHAKLYSYFHYTSERMGWIKKDLGFINDK